MEPVYTAVLVEVVLPIVSAGILAGIAWVGTIMRSRLKVNLTQQMQDTLHSAILTGLKAAMAQNLKGSLATSFAVDYVLNKGGAPTAARKLGADLKTLETLANSKLVEVEATFNHLMNR